MRAPQERGLESAPEMVKSNEEELTEVLGEAGYGRSEEAAGWLQQAAERVLDRYDGDLNKLLDEVDGDRERLRTALPNPPAWTRRAWPSLLRETPMVRAELAPFADDGALAAAKHRGLPTDAEELLTDIARGQRNEELANLVGALALVEARAEYDEVRKKAGQ